MECSCLAMDRGEREGIAQGLLEILKVAGQAARGGRVESSSVWLKAPANLVARCVCIPCDLPSVARLVLKLAMAFPGSVEFGNGMALTLAAGSRSKPVQSMNTSSPSDQRQVKLICLGDSLTGPSPGADYLADYLKWTDLLQIGLDAVFGEGRALVLNQGQAGETSAGLRAALDERLIRQGARFAVVWIGANNYADSVSHGATSLGLSDDLRDIVRRARNAGVSPLLVQYPVPRAANMERVWRHVDAGNETIGAVAVETGTPLLDLRAPFRIAAERLSLASLASSQDGVHLHPGGEVVVARGLLTKLRELGWPWCWPKLNPETASPRSGI